MCSFKLSDVSRMKPRYFRVNVNVAVSPSIMTGGGWLVPTVLLARIITGVLVVIYFKRLFLYQFATVGSSLLVFVMVVSVLTPYCSIMQSSANK